MHSLADFVLCLCGFGLSILHFSLQCEHSYRSLDGSNTDTKFSNTETVVSEMECAITCSFYHCVSFTFDTQTKLCRTLGIMSRDETEMVTLQVRNYQRQILDCGDICCTDCSGVYQITPTPGISFNVFCVRDTIGGPWTVIQRRFDGSVDFYRNWTEYKHGFGNILGEYWLGLDYIYSLLSLGQMLFVQLEGWDGTTGYASYEIFAIKNETQKYQLTIGGFKGNVGDMLNNHNQKYFSTYDNDNDKAVSRDCAKFAHGGWWYHNCYMSNLNGLLVRDLGENERSSMNWNYFYADRRQPPLRKSTMMVKRKNMG